MKYAALILALLMNVNIGVYAQNSNKYAKYLVILSDKNNNIHEIVHPHTFLSQRAIERRKTQDINLSQSDLPVNTSYIEGVARVGAKVRFSSRWFNAIVVEIAAEGKEKQLEALTALFYVQEVLPLSQSKRERKKRNKPLQGFSIQQNSQMVTEADAVFYGSTFRQINMLAGDFLHANGYTGEGMHVAIIDAGFKNADELPVFDALRERGKLHTGYDFVEGDEDVFDVGSTHGTHVFSIMAGNLPGTYVGSAPDADYWLFRTEDASSENLVEEFYWIAAAEFADSVGVDVINTSLGYTTFDDPSMNHSYSDLDGNTTYITRAADLAAAKGILVVSSAGNQGNKPWKHITAPADGDSVLTIGAVDSMQTYSSFSSLGPTSDGQIKPDIVGQGTATAYARYTGSYSVGNGTSYASPLVAGLATCLWQANPDRSNMDIIQAIQKSANQYENPDEFVGYGVPNFYTANLIVAEDPIVDFDEQTIAFAYPNPAMDMINVYYYSVEEEMVRMELFDAFGRLLMGNETKVLKDAPYRFQFPYWEMLNNGLYFLRIASPSQQKVLQVIKE
ncbi:MAG: S8 family serine peptidase [Chitinophagales bacterium]